MTNSLTEFNELPSAADAEREQSFAQAMRTADSLKLQRFITIDEAAARIEALRTLSEIETIVNALSPPNFKGQGEPVTLVEKVQWLADCVRGKAQPHCLSCGSVDVEMKVQVGKAGLCRACWYDAHT